MISVKKILTAAAIGVFAALPLSVSAATVADWQFTKSNIKSGSIESGSMVLKDVSGNGNDLTMRTYGSDYKSTASFTDESMFGEDGSLFLNGYGGVGSVNPLVSGNGIDFVTVDSAPINSNSFENGYTIEIIYKMPDDWSYADRWTSLISRLGSTSAIDTENENVTTVVHVSNCKEIQFIPANKYNQSNLSSNVWSVAMDKGENWYHIVIRGDKNGIRTFVNGCNAFRDANTTAMQGLYADPKDGRFRIGSRVLAQSGSIYRFTRGYIQEIRISDTPLEKENWLVTNPEEYIGQYGSNDPFLETPEDRYNMVFVPDAQNAAKFCGNILDIAMEWLVKNKDYANIEAVVGLGDNVENYWETDQWRQITKNYTYLAENGIKTIVPTGNHDSGNNHNFWYYEQYFGTNSPFQQLTSDYILSTSPSGTGRVCSVPAGSFNYKIMFVDMFKLGTSDSAWLRGELEKYKGDPVILVMHDIQNCSDTKPNETKLSDNGKTLWNIAKSYDNVFLMVGGHSHGYGVLELTNDYGNKVYSVLADYQFSYNGGNTLFKFAEFDEAGSKIRISTFSPYASTLSDEERTFFDVNYMTGIGHYDELDIDFKERFSNFKGFIPVGENIMTNPSFEDENGNFSLAGWLSAETNEEFGNPYATDHCYAVNSTKAISKNRGSITPNETPISTTIPDGEWAFGSRWNDGKNGLCSLKRYVKVESGKSYVVSYKVKHKTGADGGYLITSLVANEGDDENSQTSTAPSYIGTEWTTVTRSFTATDSTDYVLFWFRQLGEEGNPGKGPYWFFDDFSICEAEETSVSNGFIMNAQYSKTDDKINVTFDFNENLLSRCIVAGFDNNGELICVSSTNDGSATLTGVDITNVKIFCWGLDKNLLPLSSSKAIDIK